jgi:hypothetical protein
MINRIFIVACLVLISTGLSAQDFTRITEGAMVNDDRYSEGSSWGDINNDHFLDLFVPHAFIDKTNILFINNGNGNFTQVTEGPVVTDLSTSSGCSFGDFDNDGFLDLFVQNWDGINSHLYINNGDGTFAKVTEGDIVNDRGWSFDSNVVDYDNDGNLDVFLCNGAFTTFTEENCLYQGHGDGTFTKITEGDIVTDSEHSLGSSWCDYDNDGDQDLFVANSRPFNYIALNNFLYLNNGDGSFTKITDGVIVNDSSISIGGSWADCDNDGDFDLFVANWNGEDNSLYRNNGDATFTRITQGDIVNDGGSSVHGAWGDYDNDGDQDIYVTNDWNENNFLYDNNGDGTFTRVLTGDIVGDGGRSNGATWIDYNNDGFLDMYVPNGQVPDQSNFLYRNNGLSGNNWINIKCVGLSSNTSAIGTRIKAKATSRGRLVRQMREVSGHQGFNAQESFNVEFGLGDAGSITTLVFEWPSGTVDTYYDVDVNNFYLATEGEGLDIITTSTWEFDIDNQVPKAIELSQNYPNPFNPSTTISFEIPDEVETAIQDVTGMRSYDNTTSGQPVSLIIYDIRGRHSRTLVDSELRPGSHTIHWDGRNDHSEPVSSGIYFYTLKAGEVTSTRKMALLK